MTPLILSHIPRRSQSAADPQSAFDDARRRLEVSALYYSRAPEAAELSDRAIAEFAVAEEAVRSGKKPTQVQVSQNFADFGLYPGEQSGRSALRTLDWKRKTRIGKEVLHGLRRCDILKQS